MCTKIYRTQLIIAVLTRIVRMKLITLSAFGGDAHDENEDQGDRANPKEQRKSSITRCWRCYPGEARDRAWHHRPYYSSSIGHILLFLNVNFVSPQSRWWFVPYRKKDDDSSGEATVVLPSQRRCTAFIDNSENFLCREEYVYPLIAHISC
jgi:hypothetical protein